MDAAGHMEQTSVATRLAAEQVCQHAEKARDRSRELRAEAARVRASVEETRSVLSDNRLRVLEARLERESRGGRGS